MRDKDEYNQAVEHFNSLPHTFNTVSNGKVANTRQKAENAHKDGKELNTFIIDEETTYNHLKKPVFIYIIAKVPINGKATKVKTITQAKEASIKQLLTDYLNHDMKIKTNWTSFHINNKNYIPYFNLYDNEGVENNTQAQYIENDVLYYIELLTSNYIDTVLVNAERARKETQIWSEKYSHYNMNNRIQAETDILTNSMKPVNESISSIYYTGDKPNHIKVRLTQDKD